MRNMWIVLSAICLLYGLSTNRRFIEAGVIAKGSRISSVISREKKRARKWTRSSRHFDEFKVELCQISGPINSIKERSRQQLPAESWEHGEHGHATSDRYQGSALVGKHVVTPGY